MKVVEGLLLLVPALMAIEGLMAEDWTRVSLWSLILLYQLVLSHAARVLRRWREQALRLVRPAQAWQAFTRMEKGQALRMVETYGPEKLEQGMVDIGIMVDHDTVG